MAIDPAGNTYVGDRFNFRVRKVASGGAVTTLAGSGVAAFADGTGAGASFNFPAGVTIGGSGAIFVGDMYNRRVRRITPGGVVSSLAGSGAWGFLDGTGTGALFSDLWGLAADSGDNVFVADIFNHRIRRVNPNGVVTTLAAVSYTHLTLPTIYSV